MDTTISILVKAASLEAVFPPSDWETWTYGIEKKTLLTLSPPAVKTQFLSQCQAL
jgi:hypothetical protein